MTTENTTETLDQTIERELADLRERGIVEKRRQQFRDRPLSDYHQKSKALSLLPVVR